MSADTISSMSLSQIMARIADTVTSCGVMFLETTAQLPLGQTIFRFIDRFLWAVEKSAQWSLPTQDFTAEENGKSFGELELVRPLPWILFLPVLIMLRVLRIGLNIGSLILGFTKIEPDGMVKFLQKVRRRLRSIKSNGVKNMRHSYPKDNDFDMGEAKRMTAQLIRTIQMTLSSLSCLDNSKSSPSPPPMRIKVHNHESTPTPEEQSTTESAISPHHVESKRKYCDLSSEDHSSEDSEEETIQAKIDRLTAINDSTEDPEYDPGSLSTAEDDSASTSGDSNVSTSEIRDIKNEAVAMLSPDSKLIKQITGEKTDEHYKRVSVSKSTSVDGHIVNSNAACNMGGNCEEFYSPYKVGEDNETAFYSPISSTSSSPDRMVANYKQGLQDWPVEITIKATSLCQNGEQNDNTASKIFDSTGKTTNGHRDEKRRVQTNSSTNKSGKSTHRGKRGATHASRKKK